MEYDLADIFPFCFLETNGSSVLDSKAKAKFSIYLIFHFPKRFFTVLWNRMEFQQQVPETNGKLPAQSHSIELEKKRKCVFVSASGHKAGF